MNVHTRSLSEEGRSRSDSWLHAHVGHVMSRTNSSLAGKDHIRVAGGRKVFDQAMG